MYDFETLNDLMYVLYKEQEFSCDKQYVSEVWDLTRKLPLLEQEELLNKLNEMLNAVVRFTVRARLGDNQDKLNLLRAGFRKNKQWVEHWMFSHDVDYHGYVRLVNTIDDYGTKIGKRESL